MSKEYNSAQIFFCENNMEVRCPKGCQDHVFSLAQCSRTRTKRSHVEIRFCPYLDKTKSIAENVWPEVNFDGKHYLPCFVVGIDKIPIILRQNDYLDTFSKKLEETLKSPGEILQPHPGLGKKNCGVCGCAFKDYRAHIRSRTHKLNIKKSLFEKDIKDLTEYYSSSSKPFQNQNRLSYSKRLRSLQRSLGSELFENSINTEQRWRVSNNSTDRKQDEIKRVGDKAGEMDQQLETMTVKKSEEKTKAALTSRY